jgi:hypothetical protein
MQFVLQIGMFKNSCEVTLRELKRWMTPEKVYFTIISSSEKENFHLYRLYSYIVYLIFSHEVPLIISG